MIAAQKVTVIPYTISSRRSSEDKGRAKNAPPERGQGRVASEVVAPAQNRGAESRRSTYPLIYDARLWEQGTKQGPSRSRGQGRAVGGGQSLLSGALNSASLLLGHAISPSMAEAGADHPRPVVKHTQCHSLSSYLVELPVRVSVRTILEIPARHMAMLRIKRQGIDRRRQVFARLGTAP